MYGSQTLNMIDQIYFDLAYVTATAFMMEDGIYVEEFEDARLGSKSEVKKFALVVDHSKFNKKFL